MQFIEAGPDVPVDLVIAQERGEALFVCGAGVSRMVRLPLFRELVENVYQDMPIPPASAGCQWGGSVSAITRQEPTQEPCPPAHLGP